MRGEHAPIDWRSSMRKGSSPHARGAQATKYQVEPPLGIIPACAGSTKPSTPQMP